MKRDKVVKIARLSSCKNFVSKRKKFIFNGFVDHKALQRFENGSHVCGFRSLNNSTRKRVLDLGVYSDTTQLNCHLSMNVVTQLTQFVGRE